ncbi:MAG: hypothetical protein BWX90_01299 [bacterium ADurb.Bin132]|nr:MAG: hypothetical protein BWX90_01299 [bacterium ADurb.Bin132]
MARIWRVSKHDHYWLYFFDLGGAVDLVRNGLSKKAPRRVLLEGWWLEGVREKYVQPSVIAERVAMLLEKEAKFQVGNGIGGHHQLKPVYPLQNVPLDFVIFQFSKLVCPESFVNGVQDFI